MSVATSLQGGHAENALPQLARAVVNCRLLPGESPTDVERTLIRAVADQRILVSPKGELNSSAPSPLDRNVVEAVERVTTYGVSGIFEDVDDVRAHGRDERAGVKQFYDGLEFL